MSARRWGFALSLFLSVGVVAEAVAQVGDGARNIRANRLRWSMSRESALNVETGRTLDKAQWDAFLLYSFMDDPMVWNQWDIPNQQQQRIGSLLKERHEVIVGGAYGFSERFQLGLELPVTLYQYRSSLIVNDGVFNMNPIAAGGLGDLALTPKYRLWHKDDLSLSLLARTTIATAQPRGAYLGERMSTIAPEVAFSAMVGSFDLLANTAVMFREIIRESTQSFRVEHEGIMRLGAKYHVDGTPQEPGQWAVSATAEIFTQIEDLFNADNITGAEWLAAVHYSFADRYEAFIGAGKALDEAYTVPDWRGVAGIRMYQRSKDSDGDGIKDKDDACVDEPEDIDGFEDLEGCPDPDNDQDGILDDADECRDEAEDSDGFEDENGCPDPDNDEDGILDSDDQCPDVAEDIDEYQDKDGCLDADNDGDGIKDLVDQCPLEPEDIDGFEDENGCPDPDNDGDSVLDGVDNCPLVPGTPENQGCKKKQLVTIRGCQIDLTQKVYFSSGRSTIRSVSYPLLQNLAEVLNSQTQIKAVRIEGHTDSQGSAAYNKDLSQRRADAVMKRLIEKGGVEAGRLSAIGFGEEKPIDTNGTAAGRENNRRVELHIADCKAETKEVEVSE